MLLFSGILAGIILGAIKNGKIMRITALRGLWYAIAPLALSPILRFYPQISLLPKATIITASYLFISIFIISNRKYSVSALFLGLGTICNYIVIASNNFRMPVSIKALSVFENISAEIVYSKKADYFIAENGANLFFLGDIIYIPIPGLKGFISVGDIILTIGIFLMIISVMTDKEIVEEKDNPSRTIV